MKFLSYLGHPVYYMALSIVAASFSAVAPDMIAPYLKALAGAATGIAGLLLHPDAMGPKA